MGITYLSSFLVSLIIRQEITLACTFALENFKDIMKTINDVRQKDYKYELNGFIMRHQAQLLIFIHLDAM